MRIPVLTSLLNLYIINRVRKVRIELGLTQRDVSRILYPKADNNLLGSIESPFRKEKYTEDNLIKLAEEFSKFDPSKNYTILSFYPEQPLEEILVRKEILYIPSDIKPTGTLNLLIESNDIYLQDWHTVKEITDYCSNFAKQEWKTTDFTSVVSRAEATGKLIRQGENEPKYKKP